MIVFSLIEPHGDARILKFQEEYSLTNVVVHDEKTEEDCTEDADDENESSEDLCWTLSVEQRRNTFTYELKHQDSKEKRRWYETAYALNQRLRPLLFKKTLYRKMLTLIFAEPKVLSELVLRINKSMVGLLLLFYLYYHYFKVICVTLKLTSAFVFLLASTTGKLSH